MRETVHWECKRCDFHYEAVQGARQIMCPAGHNMKITPRPAPKPEEASCRA